MKETTSTTLELCFWPSKVNFLSHVNEFEMSLSFPNLHFVFVAQQKNVCIIKHRFGLMYCNDGLRDVVDLLLTFFVQDQRGRKDFRKAQFISLSNQIYIPL